MLRAIATALGSGLREVDLAARYGGEEFTIIMPHTSKANAEIVAQRVAANIVSLEHEFNGEKVSLTASMGIAEVTDLSEPTAENLVKAADIALYEAKRQGRNRIVLFEVRMLTAPNSFE